MIGRTLSHYTVVAKIGEGGMGEVYRATDSRLKREVALKVLPTAVAADPGRLARFQREAEAVASLNHPNIVTIYSVEEAEGVHLLTMELVDGTSLDRCLPPAGFPQADLFRIGTSLGDALQAAHEAGIVHRDLKPANVMLTTQGRVKVLDFGLAKTAAQEPSATDATLSRDAAPLTGEGTVLGTVPYMAPEQLQGRPVDARTDLFSLGVVLYELATGTRPFSGGSSPEIMASILKEEPVPVNERRPELPEELARIVRRCLAKDPSLRYRSAADVAAELRLAAPSSAGAGAAAGGDGTRVPPSIAVLPFANMSADAENEYFADGLTEELLNVLAKNAELKVTGRTSSFAFKNRQEDLRGIGKKLGVATLLEGSVRKAGNRVRITAQLVNAEDGFHLWSESYDRVLEDIFAIQDEIAAAVGEALNVTLLGASGAPGTRKVPRAPNPEAWVLTLRASQSALQFSREGLAVAVDLYRKALDLDPESAPAWAGMAAALARQVAVGYAEHSLFRKARECAERALALDDALPEAHEVMAYILMSFEHAFREADGFCRKAVSLAPANSRVVINLAVYEGMFERFDEALRLARRATELDPLDPETHSDLARILSWAGRHEEAEAGLRRALELSPGIVDGRGKLGCTLLLLGREDEALAEARKEESSHYRSCALAIVHHALGRTRESDEALAALIAEGEHVAVQIAMVHSERGERDEAFRWLERAVELGDPGIAYCRPHPMFRGLRADPRWERLLRRVGLAG